MRIVGEVWFSYDVWGSVLLGAGRQVVGWDSSRFRSSSVITPRWSFGVFLARARGCCGCRAAPALAGLDVVGHWSAGEWSAT